MAGHALIAVYGKQINPMVQLQTMSSVCTACLTRSKRLCRLTKCISTQYSVKGFVLAPPSDDPDCLNIGHNTDAELPTSCTYLCTCTSKGTNQLCMQVLNGIARQHAFITVTSVYVGGACGSVRLFFATSVTL